MFSPRGSLQRANYYTFLAGIYFDSSLLALARWPTSCLSSLSIIQDPLTHATQSSGTRKDKFAQPIVFFNLTPFSALATARSLVNTRSFRLRIPGRDVTPFLSASPSTLPFLEILDLSSCNVKDTDLERLLTRFSRVKHLILDGCAVVRLIRAAGGQAEGHQWRALGRLCALAGAKAAKEREKELTAWIKTRSVFQQRQVEDNINATPAEVGQRRARAGRKGLASATISLRHADHHIGSTSGAHGGESSEIPPHLASLLSQKLRVLPPVPSLLSLCTTPPLPTDSSLSSRVEPAEAFRIQTEFAEGWTEGIAQLRIKWGRLRTFQSGSSKVRVMCLAKDHSSVGPDGSTSNDEDPLRGLMDVDDVGTFSWEQLERAHWAPPSLCLAGTGWEEGEATTHAPECGHSGSDKVWSK